MNLGFWRKLRVAFRWCRITVWLAVLALICAFLWCNRIGLPNFLTQRLVETLRAHGMELQFTRMRLHLINGIVAENVRIGDIQTTNSPAISFAQVQLPLNFPALLHRKIEIDGLTLRQGKFVWPLSATNTLSVENIQTDLHLWKDQTWTLDRFSARFAGAKFILSGEIAHAPELRRFFRGKKNVGAGSWQARLQKFSDVIAQIRFEGMPVISLDIKGDARDARSFVARLNSRVPSIETPWGSGQQIRLAAKLDTAGANWQSNSAAAVELIGLLSVTNAVALGVPVDFLQTHFYYTNGIWQLPDFVSVQNGARMEIAADENEMDGNFNAHVRGQFAPETIQPLLRTNGIHALEYFAFTEPLALDANATGNVNDLENLYANGFVAATNFAVRKSLEIINTEALPIDLLQTHFSFSNQVLQLPDFEIAQDQTQLKITAEGNRTTKNFQARVSGKFHPQTIRPLLTTKPMAIREFNNLDFAESLVLDAKLRGQMDNFDGLGADGFVALTNMTIWKQAIGSIAGNFNYTNRVLTFLHPAMARAEGTQKMTADSVTLNFPAQLIFFTNGFSTADPISFIKMIGPKAAKMVMPWIDFPSPPTVRVDGCVPLRDINTGSDVETADLTFNILQPTPYRVKKFYSPAAQGTVHWLGQFLILSNLTAETYGGHGSGYARFDFHPRTRVADYYFGADVVDVDIHQLANAFKRTNKLEGILSGQLIVTSGNTESLMTWNGYGHATLRDGLIWDEPVFGFLSPVLNTVYPGLGNSRATAASADFGLTNGVFTTESLEIRSTIVRLNYSGTVDLEQNLNARVNGQLLRDVWGLGPIVSTVLWPMSKLFEYHVTGTLKHPKGDPVYVPKILLTPLHPIRTIEEILPGGEIFSNQPPAQLQ